MARRDEVTHIALNKPLIGRDEEINGVVDAIEEGFLEKRPVFVFVKGAPYSGRTRFLLELEFRLAIVKDRVSVFIDPHKDYKEILEEIQQLPVKKQVPGFVSLLTDELTKLVLSRIEAYPMIILIDDLEEVDQRIRDFLEFISNLDFRGQIAIITSYTSDSALPIVNSRPFSVKDKHLKIDLMPFDRSQTRYYVMEYFRKNRQGMKTADMIYEYTGGLPGLVAKLTEIVRTKGLQEIENEPEILMLVESILSYFDNSELEVLLSTAIYGDEFSIKDIADILPFKTELIAQTIEKAVSFGMIKKKNSHYRFEARLYKTALLKKFDKEKIQALHRRIATIWEKETRDPELLAMHYLEGGMYIEAARYFIAIAENYIRELQFDEARKLLKMAVDAAIKGQDVTTEFEARYELAELYRNSYEFEQLEREINKMEQLIQTLDPPKYKILYSLAKANYLMAAGDLDKSLKMVMECIGYDDPMIKERALELAISILFERGSYDKAARYTKDLLHLGRELNNEIVIAQANLLLARFYIEKRDFKKAIRLLEGVLNTFSRHGMWKQVLMAIFHLVNIYLQIKKLSLAHEFLNRGLDISESFNSEEFISLFNLVYAMFLTEVGMYDTAIEAIQKPIKFFEISRQSHVYISSLLILGHLYTIQNRFQDAFKIFQKIESSMMLIENPFSTTVDYKHYKGILLWKAGRIEEAERFLVEAYELANKINSYDQIVLVGQDLALFYIETGNSQKGEHVIKDGLKVAQKHSLPKSKFYYALFLIAKFHDDEEKARSHIENAYSDLLLQSLGLETQSPEHWNSFWENVDINRKIRREWLKYNPQSSSTVLL